MSLFQHHVDARQRMLVDDVEDENEVDEEMKQCLESLEKDLERELMMEASSGSDCDGNSDDNNEDDEEEAEEANVAKPPSPPTYVPHVAAMPSSSAMPSSFSAAAVSSSSSAMMAAAAAAVASSAENRKKRVYTPLSRHLLLHKEALTTDPTIPQPTIHNIVSTSKIVCIPPSPPPTSAEALHGKAGDGDMNQSDGEDSQETLLEKHCILPACIDLDRIFSLIPCSHYNRKKFAAITIRISEPTVTALLFTSGRLVITGSKSWYVVPKIDFMIFPK